MSAIAKILRGARDAISDRSDAPKRAIFDVVIGVACGATVTSARCAWCETAYASARRCHVDGSTAQELLAMCVCSGGGRIQGALSETMRCVTTLSEMVAVERRAQQMSLECDVLAESVRSSGETLEESFGGGGVAPLLQQDTVAFPTACRPLSFSWRYFRISAHADRAFDDAQGGFEM